MRHDARHARWNAQEGATEVPFVNPAQGRVPEERLEVRLSRGGALAGRAWRNEQPRFLVAVLHGLGEHGGRYAALASDLVKEGASVCTVDLPGHGETGGGRGDARWLVLRDQVTPALLDVARGLPGHEGRLPLFLLGHSMGGVLALDFALEHSPSLAGLVVSAPGFAPAEPPPPWKLALARVAHAVVPGLPFDSGLPPDKRSRDPEVLRLAEQDPGVHYRITPRLYFGLAAAQERTMRRAPELSLPTLVIQGDEDGMVNPSGAQAFAAAASPRVTLRTYPGMYHEVFNDLGREVVVQDLVEWMGRMAEDPAATAER